MSWIISDSTKKQNSKNDLSFYHGFSKTPVEPNTSTGNAVTTLANATTKSGHTVSATEVWASEIPWFGLVPSKAVAVTRLSGITKKNDLVRVNGDKDYIYIGEGNETFTEATWSTYWSPITLTNGMVLKNAAGEDVLRYYEKQQMQALEPNNNAGIDSKGFATRLFIDESKHTAVTTVGQGSVISQFAAGTDNIKNGIASSELNPVLYLGDTQKIAGTHYYDYNVSGTILWNANVKSSTPKITCFRYIGKTVSAKTAEIESTISDLKITAGAGITVTDGTKQKKGVTTLTLGGSNGVTVSVNESTGAVTFSVDTATIATTASVTAISNRISAAASDITATSEKLVTGKAVYDYVAGATLNSGTQGDNQIQNATSETANKLVTAAQVKEYVTENAQVTVTVGASKKTSTGFEFAGSTGTDIAVAPTMDANGKVTYAATLSKATVGTDGKILTGDENKAVSATDAKTIVDTSIAALSATGGAIATLTERVEEAEASASASEAAAKAAQSAAEGAETEATAAKTAAEKAQAAAEAAQGEAAASASAADTSAKAASSSETAAKVAQQQAAASAQSASSSAQSAADSEAAAVQAAADAKAAKEFVETTAEWQAGTDDTLGDFTSATASGVVTGTTVKTVADEVLTLAKSYSDSLHTTSLDYVVLGDSESLPTASAETLGKIYLVKEGNTANGETAIDAISGSYVEYMTRKVSEGVYAWEQIGTTAADLSAYAKTADVTTSIATAKSEAIAAAKTETTSSIATAKSEAIAAAKTETTTQVNALAATHATDKAALEASIATKVGDVQWFSENDILSTKAEVKDGKLIVSENNLIETQWQRIPANTITKIVNNKAYSNYATPDFTIETDKFKEAGYYKLGSQLTEFDSDLSNLEIADAMFEETGLKTFTVDMPKLTNGYVMFRNCNQLELFAGDLQSLDYGADMFNDCDKLKTFIGETPSLRVGTNMFYHCYALDTFIGDLSSLDEAYNMFVGGTLSEESVENIADTIKENPTSSGSGGVITIFSSWTRTDNIIKSLSRIVDKGWKLETDYDTRVAIIASNPEKYQDTTGLVEVKPSTQTYGMRGNAEPVMKEIQVVCLKK